MCVVKCMEKYIKEGNVGWVVGFVLQHKEKFKFRENVGWVVWCVLQHKETRLSFEMFSLGKLFMICINSFIIILQYFM